MSGNIVSVDEEPLKSDLRELVSKTVQEPRTCCLTRRLAGWSASSATRGLRGAGVSAGTVSNLNEKALRAWRRGAPGRFPAIYPYLFVDGIYLKRSWGGSHENVAVMVAIGVNSDGRREIVGCAEGFTESKESWGFLLWLRSRGCRA